jgi:hypothetical protein
VARTRYRRRTASSWRRTRISNSFERRGRASNHTSANRFRTTRYTNDQSKQPSLNHDKSSEPNGPDAPTSRGRVCEPYGIPTIFSGFALPESNVHAPNERIPLEYLARGFEVAQELFRRWAALPG